MSILLNSIFPTITQVKDGLNDVYALVFFDGLTKTCAGIDSDDDYEFTCDFFSILDIVWLVEFNVDCLMLIV